MDYSEISLLVFGATSFVGKETVAQALDRGYRVTAIVESPKYVKYFRHDNLKAVVGHDTDQETFFDAMRGQSAVLSCWGLGKVPSGVQNLRLASVREICNAMNVNGVHRGVFLTSWATKVSTTIPLKHKIERLARLNSLDDMGRMEDYLEMYSGSINYTVVRAPPRITDGPASEEPFVVKDNDYFISGIPTTMSRGNTARFMLDCLESDFYDMKMVTIGMG